MQHKLVLKKEHILQICLFLGFFNFIGRGTYFIIGASLLFLFFEKKIQIKIDGLFLSIGAWAVSFMICASGFVGLSKFFTPIATICCFVLGQTVIKKESMYGDFRKYYFLIASAMMVHGLINMALNIRRYGWNFGGDRTLIDLWVSTDLLATGQATLFLLMSVVLYYIILFIPKKPIVFYIGMIVAVFCGVIYNIMSASRFIVYITIASLLLSVLIYALHKKTKNKARPIIIAVCLIIFTAIIYRVNGFGIRTWLENSALAERLNRLNELGVDSALSSNARKEQIAYVLSDITLYFAGGKPTGLPFVHNTWLSVLNSGGLLLALPFLQFTIILLVVGIKQIFNCPREHSLIICGCLLGVYAYMYFEPMFEGSRMLFYAIALISGMMSKIEVLRRLA